MVALQQLDSQICRAASVMILSICATTAVPSIAPAEHSDTIQAATILTYHRFGEPNYPSTNIKSEQFEGHLEELTSGRYKLLPLPEIIRAFRNREHLPPRAVAVTIDDAYRSIYDVAWPKFRRAGLPLPIFVSPAFLDGGSESYMTWDQLRELAAAGVTIGGHTLSHPHLPELSDNELANEIDRAIQRFVAELGYRPTLFAYPYGEYGMREKAAVQKAGYEAAFGQQSGVAASTLDLFELPRFSMSESYGGLERLKLVANALPIPVRDVTPKELVLREGSNPPDFGFTIATKISNIDRLACFASNQSKPARIERLGPNRFEIRLDDPFRPPRGRINCTIPTKDGRWRWFGQQFYVSE
jgi:peptidoglycan/xylan/chitin deacetylase (PgdA/CDA1 family)